LRRSEEAVLPRERVQEPNLTDELLRNILGKSASE
jgi:hypothetical protein